MNECNVNGMTNGFLLFLPEEKSTRESKESRMRNGGRLTCSGHPIYISTLHLAASVR